MSGSARPGCHRPAPRFARSGRGNFSERGALRAPRTPWSPAGRVVIFLCKNDETLADDSRSGGGPGPFLLEENSATGRQGPLGELLNFKALEWHEDPAVTKAQGGAIVDARVVDQHIRWEVQAALAKKGLRPAASGPRTSRWSTTS